MSLPFQSGSCGRIKASEVVVIDTETTGLYPFGLNDDMDPAGDQDGPDRLCSISAYLLRRTDGAWLTVDAIAFMMDPGRPVPESAAKINGFAWSLGADVVSGRINLYGYPSFQGMAPRLFQFIGDRPVCCHNTVFDIAVLDAECQRAGLPMLDNSVLCTKKAYADIQGLGRPDRYIPGTNLNKLCDALGVDRRGRLAGDGSELHGCAVDAELAAHCFAVLEPLGWMQEDDPSMLPHRLAGLDLRTEANTPSPKPLTASDNTVRVRAEAVSGGQTRRCQANGFFPTVMFDS